MGVSILNMHMRENSISDTYILLVRLESDEYMDLDKQADVFITTANNANHAFCLVE